MRILDKHILKELLMPLFFSLYIIVFLFLVADLFDHLSEIINNNTPIKDIIKYYLYLVPFASVQTISWATFFSIIYVFLNFKRHHEIIAMKACGLKITQIAAPIFFLGIVIGVLTFVINDQIVPYTYSQAEKILTEKIEKKSAPNTDEVLKNTTLIISNRQYFIKEIHPQKNEMHDIRIHVLSNEDKYVEKKISAQHALWKDKHWIFQDVAIQQLDPKGRIIGEPLNKATYTFEEITETPGDFLEANLNTDFLSSKDLKRHIFRLESNGLNVNAERAALHQKNAFPWQSLVIMIITIPFLAQTTNIRRNLAKNVLVCLITVLSYHVLSAITLAIGNTGLFIPAISAWFTNITFMLGGLLFMDSANY